MVEVQPHPYDRNGQVVGGLAEQFLADIRENYIGAFQTLPDFTAGLNHRGQVPSDAYEHRGLAGVFLSESTLTELGGPHVPRIDFTPKPFRGLGREDSRRKVFFGNLDLLGDEQAVSMPVAVKPFDPKHFDYAIHETGMLQYMHEAGIPTLQVLGIVAVSQNEAPRSYLLTHEKPGITTLDNVEWGTLTRDERWLRMRPVIDTMALLHSNMLFHLDLRFKNVAYGEEDRSLCIVDMEEAASLRDRVTPHEDKPHERTLVVKKMSAEWDHVRESVRKFILENKGNDIEQFEDLLEFVYGPYYLTVSRTDSPYQDVLKSAYEEVLEQKRQQAYGEW